jgi:hypothetical protein
LKTLVIVLALFLSTTVMAQPKRATLADLDAIVTRVSSLREFLGTKEQPNTELLDDYYKALQSYFGDEERFSRGTFNSIIGQLRKAVDEVPTLEFRLWSNTGLGHAFRVQTTAPRFGRQIDATQWRRYLERTWIQGLKKNAEYFTSRDGRPGRIPVWCAISSTIVKSA